MIKKTKVRGKKKIQFVFVEPQSHEEWLRATAGVIEAPDPNATPMDIAIVGSAKSSIVVPPPPTDAERAEAAKEIEFRRKNPSSVIVALAHIRKLPFTQRLKVLFGF